jgi:hypothetical protein
MRRNKILTRYGGNIAGCIWFGTNAYLASVAGFGGAWNESASGVIQLAANLTSGFTSQLRFGWPLSVLQGLLGQTILQGPHILNGESGSILGYGILLVGDLPSLAEPWIQPRAQRYVEAHRDGVHGLWSRCKLLASRAFAETRLSYSVANSICLLPFIANDAFAGRYYMMPVYGGWLTGNFIAALARPQKQAAQLAAAMPNPV